MEEMGGWVGGWVGGQTYLFVEDLEGHVFVGGAGVEADDGEVGVVAFLQEEIRSLFFNGVGGWVGWLVG